MKKTLQYIIFFKPFGILSQFTEEHGKKSLSSFGPFPRDVYTVGRLDADSEGLILLTNDTALKHKLTDPRFAHSKTYLVQVEGIPTQEAIANLRSGVMIKGVKTLSAKVRLLPNKPKLPSRSTPIRFRKNIPTSWIEITLREGKNRQIRRMTASQGYPTLRLVRIQIDCLNIGKLQPGEHRSLTEKEIQSLRLSAQST